MKNNTLSIIVTIYNIEERYVKRCIDSLLKQTNDNYEIIIVDDCSSYDTSYLEKYNQKNIKFFYLNKNKGLAEARNYGINKSNGKFISFVDADDYVDSIYVETILKLFNYDVDFIRFDAKYKYNHNICNKKYNYNNDIKIISNHKTPIIKDIGLTWASWLYAIKKEFIINNNINFPMKRIYAEDVYFFLKLTYISNNWLISKIKIYNYDKTRESISISHGTSYDRLIAVWQNVLDFINDLNNVYNLEKLSYVLQPILIKNNPYKYKVFLSKKSNNEVFININKLLKYLLKRKECKFINKNDFNILKLFINRFLIFFWKYKWIRKIYCLYKNKF